MAKWKQNKLLSQWCFWTGCKPAHRCCKHTWSLRRTLKYTFKMSRGIGVWCTKHGCAVRCFSQMAMLEDTRCSVVDRVKTTHVSLPRKESKTMRQRIMGFPSVLFFLAATLAPFPVLCWDKCPVVHGKLYLLLPHYSTEWWSCNTILIVICCWSLIVFSYSSGTDTVCYFEVLLLSKASLFHVISALHYVIC